MESEIADTIVCVDCDGLAHLVSYLDPESPPVAGDVLVYRCNECYEPFYIVHETGESPTGQAD